ncbi:MAG TPA: hypothetical protein VFH27_14840 [Longimicrobiaceae bacterium]|nr:hypothetical protein [Longimicrobiaceae bacterium]
MRRLLASSVLISLAVSGCSFGGCESLRELRAASDWDFAVTDQGSSARVGGSLRTVNPGTDPDHAQILAVVKDGRRDPRNLVVVAKDNDPPNDRMVVALSLPSSAATGDQLQVSDAFAAPEDSDDWGFRAPPASGQAEVAFGLFHPQNDRPPYGHTPLYVATSATGTITVVRRENGFLRLRLDVMVADATGGLYHVAGGFYVQYRELEGCHDLILD